MKWKEYKKEIEFVQLSSAECGCHKFLINYCTFFFRFKINIFWEYKLLLSKAFKFGYDDSIDKNESKNFEKQIRDLNFINLTFKAFNIESIRILRLWN